MDNNATQPDNNMEERLWQFIDGSASADEKTVISELLEKEAAWKEKYHELLEIHQLVNATELESPSMRFTKNVMEQITRQHIAPATRTYINNRIIWGLGFFFIALLISMLVYGFGQTTFSSGSDNNISQQLDKVNISRFFSNNWINAFMFINVVIGLILLDHYFSTRKKTFRQEM
ncbi:MAG: hypothetical protein JNM88_15505 [Chitinophagaceae bacterium]|nr:hypothetical protein [Chitinophagaceae bacterium]